MLMCPGFYLKMPGLPMAIMPTRSAPRTPNKIAGNLDVPRGFMTIQQRFTKILSTMLIAGLCITPELASARQNTQPAKPQSQATTPQQTNTQTAPDTQSQDGQQQQAPQQNRGTTIDPSQGPLQPVTSYPDASQQQQNEPQNASETPQTTTTVTTTTEAVPDAPQPKKPQEPVGAANAEKVPTAGGAASKPAGVAIAPAKQHQTRSLLLKIGAIAAAGVAAGTVYALTRGTPSTPPTNGSTATQK